MNAEDKDTVDKREKLSESKAREKFAASGSVAFRYWLSQKANKRRKRNEAEGPE